LKGLRFYGNIYSVTVQKEYDTALAEFTRPDCDRLEFIKGFLRRRRLTPAVLSIKDGRFVHILSSGSGNTLQPGIRPILTAHYDRAAGSPGANDNSAAVLSLLFFLVSPAVEKKAVPVEILLTDREEMPDGSSPRLQGAFRLGALLKKKAASGIIFYHFDMCGVGDTVIVSEAGERLLERRGKAGTKLYKKMKAMRTAFLDTRFPALRGRLLSLPTPFSDNLGFLLQGFPVLQFTFLPRDEALDYRRAHRRLTDDIGKLVKRTPEINAAYKKRFNTIQPATWRIRHTPADNIASLSPGAFSLMQALCSALARWRVPE
jgi:hypothetical protein